MSGTERNSSIGRRDFLRVTRTAVAAGVGMTALGRDGGVRAAAQPHRAKMSDVIVLLPGIMGSVLRKDHHDVWAVSGGAILSGLRSLGGSIGALTLTSDPPGVDDLGDGITADRIFPDVHLLPGFWKIDGYSKISQVITQAFDVEAGRNFFEFPYDWRRDNRVSARRLARASRHWLKAWRERSGKRDAKLILIAHSMGGLVARYFLEVLEGWRETKMLVSFGTPYRGSLNALSFLANGFTKSLGPVPLIDLSRLLRSFTSVYQLLPIYPCYDPGTGKAVRVGETTGIPNVDSTRAADALRFHNEILDAVKKHTRDEAYVTSRYSLHPVVGVFQPTQQWAQLDGGRVEVNNVHPTSRDIQGDGTVPQVSGTPIEGNELTRLHKKVHISERHGSLQNAVTVLNHLKVLLAEQAINVDAFRGSSTDIGLSIEDAYVTGEPIRIRARCEEPALTLQADVIDIAKAQRVAYASLRRNADGIHVAELAPLSEGTYRITVYSVKATASVTDVFVVSR